MYVMVLFCQRFILSKMCMARGQTAAIKWKSKNVYFDVLNQVNRATCLGAKMQKWQSAAAGSMHACCFLAVCR